MLLNYKLRNILHEYYGYFRTKKNLLIFWKASYLGISWCDPGPYIYGNFLIINSIHYASLYS